MDTSTQISLANPGASWREDDWHHLRDVIQSGVYLLGEQTELLEQEFSRFVDDQPVAAVSSGTDGLFLALRAFNIGHGDKVIIPAFSPLPVAAAVLMTGATPLLVDVAPRTLTLDPDQIKIEPRIKAAIAIHLYGSPMDLTRLRAMGIVLIEDCSHAHGAPYVGTFGDVSVFSCYPTKNLGAMGDAGLVTSPSDNVIDRIKNLRIYGSFHSNGINARIDEIQAAILRIKLPRLNADNNRRRAIAEIYNTHLSNRLSKIDYNIHSVYHQYVCWLPGNIDQIQFRAKMLERGIEVGFHYAILPHHYRWQIERQSVDVAEYASRRVVSFPVWPQMSDDQVGRVIEACNDIVG